MGLINILPDEVKSKIASGEVIEGPAEVVKELVENSLDAGATRIEIEVIKGGKRFIQVKDNGMGIPSEDIEKAILSGATSKITSLEDLQKLYTYGFRGEALHSISIVSRMTLRSRFYQEDSGKEIKVESGNIISRKEVGMPVGTHIEVYDLFYNLPVRRNFLAKEDVEKRKILKIVKTLALTNPSVSFILKSEDKEIINLRFTNNLKDRIENIFEHNFEYLSVEETPFKIDLFIASKKASGTYLYINKRPVYNKELIEFLQKTIRNLCICYIELPPYLIDVNIHPKKYEVKILKENKIKDFIKKALGRKHEITISVLKNNKTSNLNFDFEVIGIIDNTLIVVKYLDYLYFFDLHLLSERYNHEIVKKSIEEACKTALKAGEKIDVTKAKELVKNWFEFENKETCPHGRPIYYRMYLGDIYKQIGRNY